MFSWTFGIHGTTQNGTVASSLCCPLLQLSAAVESLHEESRGYTPYPFHSTLSG